jgi:hypothetical protein
MKGLRQMDFGTLRFSTESKAETEQILNETFAGTWKGAGPNTYTRGLSSRGFGV